jgi:thiol:disulfide interchange protein
MRALPALLAVALAAALPACHRATPPNTPTHDSRDTVPFSPLPNYPEITWTSSLEEARARAADEHKPMIVFVRAAWSKPSVTMESTVWQDARILAEAPRFIALRVDLTAAYGAPAPPAYNDFDIKGVPTTLIISTDGRILGRFELGKGHAGTISAAMRETK